MHTRFVRRLRAAIHDFTMLGEWKNGKDNFRQGEYEDKTHPYTYGWLKSDGGGPENEATGF